MCRTLVALMVIGAFLAAGCGDDDGAAEPPAAVTSTAPASTPGVTVPVTAVAPTTQAAPTTATPTTRTPTTQATTTVPPATTAPATTTPADEITVLQRDLVDATRPTAAIGGVPAAATRTLPTTIYLPASPEPAPLIVLAHGVAGSPEKFTELATYWATRGYVVAVPRFPLSHDGLPDPVIYDVAQQGRDLTFVTDEMLAAGGAAADPVHGRIDGERIGWFGLSLGGISAWTWLLDPACTETRVDAFVQSDSIVPAALERLASVPFPVLIAHSDADPLFAYATTRAEFEALPDPAYLLTLHGALHAAVGENTDTTADEAYQQTTTAFWDRHLRGRSDAAFPAGIEGVTTFEASTD